MLGLKKKGCQDIGKSRGGLSTKIHATCDALGNPTGFYLTPGQTHELEGFDKLVPNIHSDSLIADKAYDADARVLDVLEEKGIEAVIPSRTNRKLSRDYDKHLYKERHLIENFFAKLKQYRAIATRYDKLSQTFLGAIYLASSVVWLN